MNTALIIDSDLFFTNTVKLFFSQKNIDTIICHDGMHALDYLNNKEYDFIICSDQIEHKNGLEMATLVKGIAKSKNIPYISIIGNNNPTMKKEYEKIEPDAIFTKPVDIQLMLTTISNLQLNTSSFVRVL
ncbi:MAG: response regulator [Chitinophagaceae bacterium]